MTNESEYDWIFAPKDKADSTMTTWPKWKIENRQQQLDCEAAIRHNTIVKNDRHFEFELFLDMKYPFSQP